MAYKSTFLCQRVLLGHSAPHAIMFNVSVKIDKDAIERKVIEAAEKQLREKLRARGLSSVKVKTVRTAGKMSFELSGPEEDVKKAKDLLSS